MTLIRNLVTILSLSAPLTAAWFVETFVGDDCSDNVRVDITGGGSGCVKYGGNSWGLDITDGCHFNAWSGNNCEGSSTKPITKKGCYKNKFGSILVAC